MARYSVMPRLHFYIKDLHSNPPLIETPLLPNNCVLIREVSFGERKDYLYMHSQYLLARKFSSRGVSSLECPLIEGSCIYAERLKHGQRIYP